MFRRNFKKIIQKNLAVRNKPVTFVFNQKRNLTIYKNYNEQL